MSFFNKIVNGMHNSANLTLTELGGVEFTDQFAGVFCRSVYSKIMHECAARAMVPQGVEKSGYLITVHDSYSPFKRGLVSCVVEAMVKNDQVWLQVEKLDGDIYIFHKVNKTDAVDESGNVKGDIIELDFRKFYEAKAVCLLFDLLQGIMQTMSKNVTVSGALLIKIHELSQMIANDQNMKPLIEQITQLNDGLIAGKPGFVDAKSSLEFPDFDSAPAEAAITFIFSLISALTGLPNSYLFGEVVGGLGDNSNSDTRRMNAAISRYYHSIFSGVLYATYNKLFDYKQIVDDVNQLISAFAFIESTRLLTDDGKLKFMVNNTGMDEDDFAIGGGNG